MQAYLMIFEFQGDIFTFEVFNKLQIIFTDFF